MPSPFSLRKYINLWDQCLFHSQVNWQKAIKHCFENPSSKIQKKWDGLVSNSFSPMKKSKTVLNSGFHALHGSRIPRQWNWDSGFQSLVGFRIPWTVFRIPNRISDSTSNIFQIPKSRPLKVTLYGTILSQHSVATLLRLWFKWLQHCSNNAMPRCAKNRRCLSSRVTSPLHGANFSWGTHEKLDIYYRGPLDHKKKLFGCRGPSRHT